MNRQLVLCAAFSLILLAMVMTPGCQGQSLADDEQEDNAEAEDVNADEEEQEDGVEKMLLARLLEDQIDQIYNKKHQVSKQQVSKHQVSSPAGIHDFNGPNKNSYRNDACLITNFF
jgi:hypothetical protein